MDHEVLECQIPGHENEVIIGMCMNNSCNVKRRVLCIRCLRTIHAGCKFDEKQQFTQKLSQLRLKTEQDKDQQLISLLRVFAQNSQHFIILLDQFANNVILNYEQIKRINLIQQILNQHSVSINDWEQAYQLIINQLEVASESTNSVMESLNQITQSIDKIIKIQVRDELYVFFNQIRVQLLAQPEQKPFTIQKPLRIEAKHSIQAIAQSSDDRYIASAGGQGDNQIKIWDQITGQQVGHGMKGHTFMISSINYSKCGNYIVSSSYDNTIRQWNVQTQLQIGESMIGHQNYIMQVQYTPDQKYIVSCSWDQTIRVWQSKTGKEYGIRRIHNNYPVYCLSLSPISNNVAFGDKRGIIRIFDYEYNQQCGQSLQGHESYINSLQYSNDGNLILSGGGDKSIIIWDEKLRYRVLLTK